LKTSARVTYMLEVIAFFWSDDSIQREGRFRNAP
jgi:hypothetical protein